jgi:thymidylate synthase (FAD)
MAKFERVEDKWKELRKDLYGNVEPEVTLEAITMPVTCDNSGVYWNSHGDIFWRAGTECEDSDIINWEQVERLPALAAGVSYGTKNKLENDSDKAIQLNKKLIKMGHHTPLESIQINFGVSGISKACGAQISRHRVGQGHVSTSRRFKAADPQFVYPVLDYIQDEEHVKEALKTIERINLDCYEEYIHLQSEYQVSWVLDPDTGEQISGPAKIPMTPLKKEDRRMVLPISYATERTWWINVRALRDFFRLRLAADAEWEIRRVAWMMFDLVSGLLPSLFEDLTDESKIITRGSDDPFSTRMFNLLYRNTEM